MESLLAMPQPTRLTFRSRIVAAALVASAVGVAYAQTPATQAPRPGATISDPEGPAPSPANVPFTLPKDLKWTGQEGRQQTAILYGDPTKEGPYGIVIRWYPGNFSRPHFHDHDRWAYVVSGTWWVSESTVYDEKTTYPMHAGTFVTNPAGKIHWDGARAGEKEPATLVLTGIGPVRTTQVDEQGKPRP
jgi:quercetin dioxygenase-like cupin family protein